MSVLGISLGKNKEQQELVRCIQENPNNSQIIFAIGRAGTGKTFITLATALEAKIHKKYSKVIYARNPVQIGEDMGALPGDIDDKYSPFMGPLMDNLEAIERLSKDGVRASDLKMKVEITPIAFLRGRSFEDAIIIIDEAQNLDLTALKTILTRVGKFCKVVLLGSMNQIDDYKQRKQEKCDFQKVIEKLSDRPYVRTIELIDSMRSPICTEIDELLGEIDRPTETYKCTVVRDGKVENIDIDVNE